ncbi:MAG TPA: hypothetical protein VEZ17_06500 [Chitinophagaceae bacterium]|jgi:FtsH-binding integral membrane protein|nr:hypothetical protein [Chitinophagaceae bacterium]
MQQEKPFSELDSIALIESMINKAKNQFSDNGHLYLLWGWVIFICSAGQFILMNVATVQQPQAIWTLSWLAFIYQLVYLFRARKKRKVKTYADAIVGYVWLSFVISMFLIGFIIGFKEQTQSFNIAYAVFLALYGIPTFLSGIILRFKPLITGGIGCWILAVIAAFTSPQIHLLLISAAMIVAWIIPGYLLRSRFKNQAV